MQRQNKGHRGEAIAVIAVNLTREARLLIGCVGGAAETLGIGNRARAREADGTRLFVNSAITAKSVASMAAETSMFIGRASVVTRR